MTSDQTPDVRRVLLIAHTGRDDARVVAGQFCRSLYAHDIALRLLEDEAPELGLDLDYVEVVKPTRRRRPRLRAGAGHRRRRHDPARGRAGPRVRDAAAGREPRARRLPRRGRGRRRRHHDRGDRAPALRRRGAAHPRRVGLPGRHRRRARAGHLDLGAQRGQRREGRPGADARGGRRGRRAAAVPLGLRRGRVRDTDRLHRLQLQRRRPDRLAGCRGPAHGADQCARAVRASDGRGADVGARGRGDRAHRGRRGALVRRPTHRRPAAGCPHRGAPRRDARSGWCGCTRRRSPTGWWRSSTCRSPAGAGTAERRRREENGGGSRA